MDEAARRHRDLLLVGWGIALALAVGPALGITLHLLGRSAAVVAVVVIGTQFCGVVLVVVGVFGSSFRLMQARWDGVLLDRPGAAGLVAGVAALWFSARLVSTPLAVVMALSAGLLAWWSWSRGPARFFAERRGSRRAEPEA